MIDSSPETSNLPSYSSCPCQRRPPRQDLPWAPSSSAPSYSRSHRYQSSVALDDFCPDFHASSSSSSCPCQRLPPRHPYVFQYLHTATFLSAGRSPSPMKPAYRLSRVFGRTMLAEPLLHQTNLLLPLAPSASWTTASLNAQLLAETNSYQHSTTVCFYMKTRQAATTAESHHSPFPSSCANSTHAHI